MAAFLRGTRVILCTLSMLTSPRLQELGFSEIIPVNNVVVDEGSSIMRLWVILIRESSVTDPVRRLVADVPSISLRSQENMPGW